MSAIEPFHVKREVSDLSDFSGFVVPSRTLTAPERAVYRELALEWAVLDAKAQATLYAQLLDGRLADYMSSIVTQTAHAIYTREEGIAHEKTHKFIARFHGDLLEEHGRHQLGLYRTQAEHSARVIQRDMIPKPKKNWWRRVLDGEPYE